MVESRNLNEYFDKNRECSPEILSYLNDLWLDTSFKEQCIAMFEETRASVIEVTSSEPILLAENTKIQLQGEKQNLNTIAETELNSAANDEDYNSTRQYKKIA